MPITSEQFSVVSHLVFDKAKIVLQPGKEYLVESRLSLLARELGVASVSTLIDTLRSRPSAALENRVVDAMTTNETSWFRDSKPFDALRTTVLPDLIARRATSRSLVVWSLACSTGQEAYSVVMLIREHFPELSSWNINIVGGDISPTVVEKAREAKYSQLEVNRGLPATMLLRYFDREGMNYRLRPEIRRCVIFREMNLAGPWPSLPVPDIVFLRNVMIYMDVPTKRSILAHLARHLAPDGYLFLGAGETTLNVDPSYERTQSDGAGCFRFAGAK